MDAYLVRDARRWRAMAWCGKNKDSEDPAIVAIGDGLPDAEAMETGDEVADLEKVLDLTVAHLISSGVDLDSPQ